MKKRNKSWLEMNLFSVFLMDISFKINCWFSVLLSALTLMNQVVSLLNLFSWFFFHKLLEVNSKERKDLSFESDWVLLPLFNHIFTYFFFLLLFQQKSLQKSGGFWIHLLLQGSTFCYFFKSWNSCSGEANCYEMFWIVLNWN